MVALTCRLRRVPLRRVYAQPEIIEEGERDVFQLNGRREGSREESEVVHAWEQPDSRQSLSPADPMFLCVARFSGRGCRL